MMLRAEKALNTYTLRRYGYKGTTRGRDAMSGTTRLRKCCKAVAAPFVAVAIVVFGAARPAGAATANQQNEFSYTSSRTQDTVNCTIEAAFNSTQQAGGSWSLTAYVRIAPGSSAECLDGVAHLRTRRNGGQTDDYIGGGSSVQVTATTPTEVTSIGYELYFNGCACYTPLYTAPK
jgi:hypothetical protein